MIVAIGFALVAHQPAAAHTRQIEGTILLPAAKAAPALQPVDRPARCAWLATGPRSQGVLGWVVELTAEDTGHTFSLSDALDPDVSFYADLGTCDGSDPISLQTFSGLSWEAGTIPTGARYAVITVASNSATRHFVFGIF